MDNPDVVILGTHQGGFVSTPTFGAAQLLRFRGFDVACTADPTTAASCGALVLVDVDAATRLVDPSTLPWEDLRDPIAVGHGREAPNDLPSTVLYLRTSVDLGPEVERRLGKRRNVDTSEGLSGELRSPRGLGRVLALLLIWRSTSPRHRAKLQRKLQQHLPREI